MKTYHAKPNEVEREWVLIDATDQVLGRVATKAAQILKGKHKPQYTPHVDTGDYVVIINADKIRVTGTKATGKVYYRHSGYPGGLKEIKYRKLMQTKSTFAFKEAVRRMLPKGPLGYAMLKKLHAYAGSEHTHQAQKPVEYKL